MNSSFLHATSELGVIMYLLGIILVIAIVLLWIFLPFAVFGTKRLLEVLIKEQQRTNDLLKQVRDDAVSGVYPYNNQQDL